jgi:hypothetical protein
MKSLPYKLGLLVLAVVLLAGGGQFQNLLNRERVKLGLTPLPNDPAMPPVLALTTQALGGFRGLIANALWIRANDLQLDDKYFEMVQLARWITLLEPRFVQVWVVQAWNMAYNISVKFTDPNDRWRWVRHGIELLRDEALRYNPDEALIYRELAWFFQHKMGANMDDAHFFYKAAWAREMTEVLADDPSPKWDGHPDFEELIHPKTDKARARAALLRDKYKLDPVKMKQVDDEYGPLDWRLPEAHAIYWAFLGLAKSKPQDLIALRRVIYQSMQLAFQRGRLKIGPDGKVYLAPNLEIIRRADKAYEQMAQWEEASNQREAIQRAHRNFLKEAVYELYIHNRLADGETWLKRLREKFPDAVPGGMSLSDLALSRALGEVKDGSQVRMTSVVQAFVTQSYIRLIEGEDEQAAAFMQRAQEMYDAYVRRSGNDPRLRITPPAEVRKQVLDELLDPKSSLTPEAKARLRTKLGLPAPAP